MKFSGHVGSLGAITFALNRLSWSDGGTEPPSDPSEMLVEGWDVVVDRSAIDAPTLGIWRSQQLVPPSTDCGWKIGKPILAMDMSVEQFAAGLWRQLKILPTTAEDRQEDCADPFRDPYGRVGSRDRSLEPFLGVSVRAMAMFLDNLRRFDPVLTHTLLSKNFASFEHDVEQFATIPWPNSCLALFQREGRKSVIPPVLALILHASLAQFAQTHAGHLSLAFAGSSEITPKVLIGLLNASDEASHHVAAQHVAGAAAMQTYVWMSRQPNNAISSIGTRQDLLSSAYHALARGRGAIVRADQLIATHPGSFGARKGQSAVMAHRGAVTRFGLTWRDSAALNLLIVHKQMKAWESEYGQRLKRSRKASSLGWRPGSLSEAMSRTLHFWLETVVPEAADNELRLMVHSSGEEPGQPIESVGGKDVGRQMLNRARKLWSLFNRPSAIGYSALAHPSLWLSKIPPDQSEFNNLGVAAQNDLSLQQSMSKIPASLIETMSLDCFRPARRARRRRPWTISSDTHVACASRAAQALSMMMHVQATDPMHRALLDRAQ